ncbi:MAG: tRNA pseudouridine(38-40) synthase TruA [Fimbriimonadaceae bacterium]|nr:tRNA pseudouridine(38-40) synthase TruA [Fimbriimonadaceae bacterium]
MLTKHRIKLTVAYDGTDFCGWASQAEQRTVHGTLTEGLRQVLGEDVELWGASRTDSGAHAKGQVCHFDCMHPVPVERWPRILNKILPKDISVLDARLVSNDFNSRFMAKHREYHYRILMGERDPHRMRFAHYYGRPLDVSAMKQAATHLLGEHDFLAYSQQLEGHENTVRTLFKVKLNQVRDEVVLQVIGTAFVRGMMRRIAGGLLEVGRGARKPEYTAQLFTETFRSGMDWPPVLPANGLTLIKVTYGRHPSDHRKEILDSDSTSTNLEKGKVNE